MENLWKFELSDNVFVFNKKVVKGRLFKVLFPSIDFGKFKVNSAIQFKVHLASEIAKTAFGDAPLYLLDFNDEYVLFGERK